MPSDYDAPNIEISNVRLVEIIKQTDRAFLLSSPLARQRLRAQGGE